MQFNNWKTTVIGVVFAVLTYIMGIGAKLPSTKQEWFSFVIACALAAIGVVAKDFNVSGGTTQATDSEGDPLKPKK